MREYKIKVCLVGTMTIYGIGENEDSIQTIVENYFDHNAKHIDLSDLVNLTVEPVRWEELEEEYDDY